MRKLFLLALVGVVGCTSESTATRPTNYQSAPKSDSASATSGGGGGETAAPPPSPTMPK